MAVLVLPGVTTVVATAEVAVVVVEAEVVGPTFSAQPPDWPRPKPTDKGTCGRGVAIERLFMSGESDHRFGPGTAGERCWTREDRVARLLGVTRRLELVGDRGGRSDLLGIARTTFLPR